MWHLYKRPPVPSPVSSPPFSHCSHSLSLFSSCSSRGAFVFVCDTSLSFLSLYFVFFWNTFSDRSLDRSLDLSWFLLIPAKHKIVLFQPQLLNNFPLDHAKISNLKWPQGGSGFGNAREPHVVSGSFGTAWFDYCAFHRLTLPRVTRRDSKSVMKF